MSASSSFDPAVPYDRLPQMNTFIQYLGVLNPTPLSDMGDNNCSICQGKLVSDVEDVVDLPRRHHMVHQTCLVKSLGSTSASRNKCPECRQTLCQLNVLSLEKEAARRVEEAQHFDAMVDFDTNAFAWLMRKTDAQFMKQCKTWGLRVSEDYVRIYGIVRQYWQHYYPGSANIFVCSEHKEIGDDWLEYVVAQRIRRRILDEGESGSKAGYLFLAHFQAMEENFQRYHNNAAPRVEEQAEEEEQDAGGINMSQSETQIEDMPATEVEQASVSVVLISQTLWFSARSRARGGCRPRMAIPGSQHPP
jgi:hypothetical protein